MNKETKCYLWMAEGGVLALAGLWLPFYLGSLLPANWLDPQADYWWTAPMVLTLFLGGAAVLTLGGCMVLTGLLWLEKNAK